MANLNGQNIGTNYKGIINIGSTVNQNVSASLQSLTDGDGNLLPLQISTTQMSIGGGTAPARLNVRGDGTNPIFRAENSDGTYRYLMTTTQQIANVTNGGIFSIRPNEGTTNNPGIDFIVGIFGSASSIAYAGARYIISHTGGNNNNAGMLFSVTNATSTINTGRFNFGVNSTSITTTSGNSSGLVYTDTFAAAAGSANYRPLSINYTINNSGAQTGSTTGIYLNAIETNLNGMAHNLIDLQIGGVSRLRLSNNGRLNIASLPTSSAGLSAGDIWNNGGVLNIV